MNVEEMAVKLAETESRSKSNTHRIDRLEKSADALNRLATSIEVMATEQGHQTEAIKGVMLRRRFPKGTDFCKVKPAEVEAAANWLNQYPREIFGYASSDELFREELSRLA